MEVNSWCVGKWDSWASRIREWGREGRQLCKVMYFHASHCLESQSSCSAGACVWPRGISLHRLWWSPTSEQSSREERKETSLPGVVLSCFPLAEFHYMIFHILILSGAFKGHIAMKPCPTLWPAEQWPPEMWMLPCLAKETLQMWSNWGFWD